MRRAKSANVERESRSEAANSTVTRPTSALEKLAGFRPGMAGAAAPRNPTWRKYHTPGLGLDGCAGGNQDADILGKRPSLTRAANWGSTRSGFALTTSPSRAMDSTQP